MSLLIERPAASADPARTGTPEAAAADAEAAGPGADVTSPAEPARAWQRACRVDDLEPSWGEAVLLRAKQIALVLFSPREIYAVEHQDPATGSYVMARGIVGSKGDRPTIASPLHKQVYDLGTGECFTHPELVLSTYRTRVVCGFVEVEV
jgi:nitrite reductase (NADH) small subunit